MLYFSNLFSREYSPTHQSKQQASSLSLLPSFCYHVVSAIRIASLGSSILRVKEAHPVPPTPTHPHTYKQKACLLFLLLLLSLSYFMVVAIYRSSCLLEMKSLLIEELEEV